MLAEKNIWVEKYRPATIEETILPALGVALFIKDDELLIE